jgi:hypothetical protein
MMETCGRVYGLAESLQPARSSSVASQPSMALAGCYFRPPLRSSRRLPGRTAEAPAGGVAAVIAHWTPVVLLALTAWDWILVGTPLLPGAIAQTVGLYLYSRARRSVTTVVV